jgi:hypothetical protein
LKAVTAAASSGKPLQKLVTCPGPSRKELKPSKIAAFGGTVRG